MRLRRLMIGSVIGRFREVRADTRGATLIEFALIAPAFIALLLAILETALVFFAQESLETAAEQAGRQLMTGQVQTGTNTAAAFKTIACQQLYAFMSCSNLLVDVQNYATFDQVSTTPPTIIYDANGNPINTWSYATGGAGAIVVLRLMYIWRLPNGPLGFTVSDSGTNQKLLIATTVAKTEPYAQP